MIRVSRETIEAMRLAASEIAVVKRQWLNSDEQRLAALVEYWQRTKSQSQSNKLQQPMESEGYSP
jgi:hypothetical protein